jgi:CBS domain containing-hemolysin-like protein
VLPTHKRMDFERLRAACLVARPIRALVRAVAWPGRILTLSTRAVLMLLRQRGTPAAPLVSEDEVRDLVREGVSHRIFEHQESALQHRVFEFTDTPVRAVMVPRPKILALGLDMAPGEVLTQAVAYGHTRFPVVRGSVDDPVGVVVIKDLLRCAADGKPRCWPSCSILSSSSPRPRRSVTCSASSSGSTRTWPWSSTSTGGPSGW